MLTQVLLLMWTFALDLPIFEAVRMLPSISRVTVGNWYHKFRLVIVKEFRTVKLTGKIDCLADIVEIDESLFGKKNKYSRGKLTKKVWVFGIAQRQTRKTRFFVVPNRKNATLHPLICENIEQGVCIFHDDWAGYKKLNELGFPHGTVVHKTEFKSAEGVCTNLIEGLWGNIKMKIYQQHGLRHYMLQPFLDEWSYRYELNTDNVIWFPLLRLLHWRMSSEWPSTIQSSSEYTASSTVTVKQENTEEALVEQS